MDLCWAPWETVCNQSPAWALGVVLRNVLRDFERSDPFTHRLLWVTHEHILVSSNPGGWRIPCCWSLTSQPYSLSACGCVCVWQHVTETDKVKNKDLKLLHFRPARWEAGFVLCCLVIAVCFAVFLSLSVLLFTFFVVYFVFLFHLQVTIMELQVRLVLLHWSLLKLVHFRNMSPTPNLFFFFFLTS